MTGTHEHAAAPEVHDTPHVEDWSDETFVAGWLERREHRQAERTRHFALIRAVIPKTPDQEFRYLNLGAGPGELDELLLERFPGAVATLLDVSLLLLAQARQRLERFGDRVEYIQANLGSPEWVGAVGAGFDLAVSTNALHHLGSAARLRPLYAEMYGLMGHGGILLNLDRVRPEDPALAPLAAWVARDPEAAHVAGEADHAVGEFHAVSEHTGWLTDAGFNSVDVLWKDLTHSLLLGVRDHFHMPQAAHSGGRAATITRIRCRAPRICEERFAW